MSISMFLCPAPANIDLHFLWLLDCGVSLEIRRVWLYQWPMFLLWLSDWLARVTMATTDVTTATIWHRVRMTWHPSFDSYERQDARAATGTLICGWVVFIPGLPYSRQFFVTSETRCPWSSTRIFVVNGLPRNNRAWFVCDITSYVSSVRMEIVCEWRLKIEPSVTFIVIIPPIIMHEGTPDEDAMN
jgi:hypothetical protein